MAGSDLVSALSDGADKARHALAVEAGRIADRLDELDRIIEGKGVLELMRFRVLDAYDDGDEKRISVHVKFDSVLAEARQQANALRQLLVSLGLSQEVAAKPAERSSVLDELAKRRASRGSGAAP